VLFADSRANVECEYDLGALSQMIEKRDFFNQFGALTPLLLGSDAISRYWHNAC